MAIYFPNQVPSTGQKAGEAFAGGIGNALNTLAQQKMSQLAQRNQMAQVGQALESLGLPSQLAALPESVQQTFVKQHLAQPQQQAFADALSSILGGGTEQQQAAGTQIAPQLQQVMSGGQQQMQRPSSGIKIPGGLSQQQATQLAGIGLKQRRLQEQERQFMTKQDLEREKIRLRKQEHWDKETLPVYKEIADLSKAANDSDMRLARMEQLNQSGDLNAPGFEAGLKVFEEGLPFGLKIDLNALRTADTQEFNKLSTDFLKDAKKFFGSRITDNEVKLFLKTVPTITNSPEGRRRVIQNLRMFNEAARVRSDIMNNIIEENNGERPRNLGSLIEKRAKPKIDDIAKRFRIGINAIKKEKPKKKESQGSLFSSLAGGLDNPMDIVNALSGAKDRIGGFLSGLWGS